jgi:hypothetical protein
MTANKPVTEYERDMAWREEKLGWVDAVCFAKDLAAWLAKAASGNQRPEGLKDFRIEPSRKIRQQEKACIMNLSTTAPVFNSTIAVMPVAWPETAGGNGEKVPFENAEIEARAGYEAPGAAPALPPIPDPATVSVSAWIRRDIPPRDSFARRRHVQRRYPFPTRGFWCRSFCPCRLHD